MNPRMQTRVDAMTSGLSLTPDQVTQVTQIMTDFLQKKRQLRQSGGGQDQIKEARRTMRQSVENIFSADQKAKYETNKQQYWRVNQNDADDDGDENENAAN